ncbi:hypothetical protein H4R19_000825 [Coemansia spiralis]|nr:hypothetical protein H4R19_000825 [Coemansia spiralis]
MVHGGDINTGISTWRQFIRDNSALADKSLAIADVMDSDYMVCAGLYPRCLGKTTFLDLLYNFLAVVSKVPYSQRREKFTSYAIHEKGPEFFSKHFCRYAVFKLDFKVSRSPAPSSANPLYSHANHTTTAHTPHLVV